MDNVEQVREMEAALIGAVLRDGTKYAEVCDTIKPESFGVHIFGYVWKACEKLQELGLNIDVFTVGDELERMGKLADFTSGIWSGRALLGDLRSNGNPRNVMDYAATVQDYAIKRELEAVFTQGVIQAKNGRRSLEIIHDVSDSLANMYPHSQSDEYTAPISSSMSKAYDLAEAAGRGEIVGVPTGFVDLDRVVGSLYKDNVYLVAARPGQGKTALLLTIARHAAESGKRIAIFSLEMSGEQVAQRLAAQIANVDLSKIIFGRMEPAEWQRYTDATAKVANLPIVINDLSSININSIRQTARKIRRGGLDLVVMDYIQLAEGTGNRKFERRELEVSEVSRGLKYLARELEVPVLAAAQLNRAIEQRAERKPVLSDLRESGSLEQDAYCVMFIYEPDEKMPTKRELIIAKHRNGAVGSIDLIWNAQFTRFDNAISKTFRLNE